MGRGIPITHSRMPFIASPLVPAILLHRDDRHGATMNGGGMMFLMPPPFR